MQEVIYTSATALARAIRAKEISSAEVVQASLQRITVVNPALNAVVQLRAEAALAEARAADAALARGQIIGPLHGVPMTIKDSLDTAGVITTGGTTGRTSFVPAQDATVVARLRAAGAILLGKTNTPELTLWGETDNLVYGRTNNPYDLTRTPGGSSGGAAASVAAGGAPFDIGSDTRGSIRVPAHFTGIAGIKPTSGRVPRTGHIVPWGLGAVDALTQLGPLARYVEDLVLTLPIIAGVDWSDPAIVPMPLGDPQAVPLQGLRVARYTDNGILAATPDTVAAVHRAATALTEAGALVHDDRPAGLERAAVLCSRRAPRPSIHGCSNGWKTPRPCVWTTSPRCWKRSIGVAAPC
jgi:amidase